MADATEMRQSLLAFLGEDLFRKFVQQGFVKDRLRYWQEKEWDRFTAAQPEFAVEWDELAVAIRICHFHGDLLQPDTVDVFRGCIDYSPDYISIRNERFPCAARDVFSTEGRPFPADRVEVWFCPTCRETRAAWEAKRDRRVRPNQPLPPKGK